MPADHLTEEDVFSNDVDPLEGIRQLRKQEAQDEPTEPESTVEESDDTDIQDNADEEINSSDNSTEETESESEQKESDDSDNQEVFTEDDNDDEESDDQEDDSTDTSSDSDSSTLDLNEKRTFKANGQEFEFTVQEMLDQFGTVFGKSVDYTQKTQKIAPYRKMVSALEEQKVTPDMLNLAIDALKGDTGAIKKLLDDHNIDPYDLSDPDQESPYVPNQYGHDDATLNLKEVIDTISTDPEYAQTADVVQNQWDKASQNQLANNPVYLEGLHNDIKSGLFTEVASEATKLKVLDGNTKSDIEYYLLAGQQVLERKKATEQTQKVQTEVSQKNRQTQEAVQNADKASSEATKRRSAASTRSRADRSVVDYLDDDDEAFDDWYNNLMSSH